jgi:hypothetical protein
MILPQIQPSASTFTNSTQPSQKYTQQKLSREFQATLTEFQNVQRRTLEKERTTAAAARAPPRPPKEVALALDSSNSNLRSSYGSHRRMKLTSRIR